DLLVADAVEQDQHAAGDDGAAVALADVLLPDDRRAVLGPGLQEPRLGGDAVTVRPEELGPVSRPGLTTKTQRAPSQHKEESTPQEPFVPVFLVKSWCPLCLCGEGSLFAVHLSPPFFALTQRKPILSSR